MSGSDDIPAGAGTVGGAADPPAPPPDPAIPPVPEPVLADGVVEPSGPVPSEADVRAVTATAGPEDGAVPVDAVVAEAAGGGLSWIPFAAYLGLWVGLSVSTVWLLSGATTDHPARWMDTYEPLVWAGVGLALLGPVLSLIVWLVARARRPRHMRAGLLASAMTRGAVTAFFGALIWIGTLSALEIRASQGGW